MLFTHLMANPSWVSSKFLYLLSSGHELNILKKVSLSNLQKKAVLGVKFTKTEATGMLVRRTMAIFSLSFDSAPRSRRPQVIRLIVSGVSRDTSWQVRNCFPHFGQVIWPL